MADLAGALAFDDCSGWTGTIPDPFPSNTPECDLLLTGFSDLRGLTPGIDVDPGWVNRNDDMDCLFLEPGVAFSCLESVSYDSSYPVIWSVRPMDYNGAIVFLSVDEGDDLAEYADPTSVQYLALNNLLTFAAAGAGGDPHILTFDHEKFDLDGVNTYNFFRDSNVAINARTAPFGKFARFIDKVGITFGNNQILAIGSGNHFKFKLNGDGLVVGDEALNGTVRLSPAKKDNREELARYLLTTLEVFYKGYTITVSGGVVGDFYPFFNVGIKLHHISLAETTRDVQTPGLFQVHDISSVGEFSRDLTSRLDGFIVEHVFSR
jgi:hypothetical protein